jgi:hypothetical protein
MNSHTPSPWACTYTSNHAHDYRLTRPDGQPLPINAEANDHSEQRANARLIAAAPDLLEALNLLIGAAEQHSMSNDPDIKQELTTARAAIASIMGA